MFSATSRHLSHCVFQPPLARFTPPNSNVTHASPPRRWYVRGVVHHIPLSDPSILAFNNCRVAAIKGWATSVAESHVSPTSSSGGGVWCSFGCWRAGGLVTQTSTHHTTPSSDPELSPSRHQHHRSFLQSRQHHVPPRCRPCHPCQAAFADASSSVDCDEEDDVFQQCCCPNVVGHASNQPGFDHQLHVLYYQLPRLSFPHTSPSRCHLLRSRLVAACSAHSASAVNRCWRLRDDRGRSTQGTV